MGQSSVATSDYKREKEATESDRKLGKKLSTLDLFFLAFSGMVGSGWLYGSAASAFYAGPGSILSWPIAGVIVFFILFTWAEVGLTIPKSGGLVRYSSYVHGPFTSFAMGITYLMSSIVVPTLEAEAIVGYLSAYIPNIYNGVVLSPVGVGISAVFVLIMFFVNYYGINLLRRVNSGVSYWKAIIPILTFIFLLLLEFHGANYGISGTGSFLPYGFDGVLYAIPAGGVIFALEGFRQPIEFAGEARSTKSLLKASVAALITVIILYTFLEMAFVGSVRWSLVSVLPGNWTSLVGTAYYSTPFYFAMKTSAIPLLGAFAVLLLIDAWVSPFGTGLVYFGNAARDIFGLGADNFLPKGTLNLNKYRIPFWGAIITVIASVLFLLPFPSWYALIGYASAIGVLNYTIGGSMLAPLRKLLPNIKRSFTLPYASIIAPIGFIGAILIVYWSGFSTVWAVLTTIFLSIPIVFFTYVPANRILDSNGKSVTIGAVTLVITIIMTYFSYIWLVNPPSSFSVATQEFYFLVYYIIMLATIIAVMAISYYFINKTSKAHLKKITSFSWVIALVFVLLIFSFFGSFHLNLIQFPLDTGVVIVASIPIYFVSRRAAYETEQLKSLKESLSQEGDIME
ncbi:MAG: APC family permease [Candidatus Thermoplasmatota archaeon]|jgi:amino acid transporter|nr:APC family permease [Candidatus Thermoplasmatota archaeon]MCL5790170.1 APC family permease [Candidatus Thermoplasmatota archaeon]